MSGYYSSKKSILDAYLYFKNLLKHFWHLWNSIQYPNKCISCFLLGLQVMYYYHHGNMHLDYFLKGNNTESWFSQSSRKQ